jgi:hypothetical protein
MAFFAASAYGATRSAVTGVAVSCSSDVAHAARPRQQVRPQRQDDEQQARLTVHTCAKIRQSLRSTGLPQAWRDWTRQL